MRTPSPQVGHLMNKPEAAASANVNMPTSTNIETKAPNPKKRSVNNMKPDALQKKRENDRNAQRNIREKQRKNLAMLQQKVDELEKAQDHYLKRRLDESEDLVRRLLNLLTQHGISTRTVLSPAQSDMFGSLDMDQPGSRPSYQSQQYSPIIQHFPPINQQMYPVGPHQPMLQRPVQYMMGSQTESPPSQFTGSPESMGSSLDTPPRLLTQSSQLSGQSQPIGPNQHMRAISQMGSSQSIVYPQALDVQASSAFPPMENTEPMATTMATTQQLVSNPHPMAHPQSMGMGMMPSSPEIKFEETAFQSFTSIEEEWYNAQNNLTQSQPQPQLPAWDNSAIFQPNQGTAYSAGMNLIDTKNGLF
ncbi:hypothetical protein DSL72_006343 [Monilinia vaccinii-corymbosi]|uniref:BZIP domain-containing protein n=1 Tax=Monilinia vaccinii-corymbosi TaxID=61207 RepID=A0A8A3PNG7_9HELO|nr:hypothetical protein DSL72_006343 [Monilinia vaccinii-corymbosi]